MYSEHEHLRAGIVALEAQRATLGDAIVDALTAAARGKLAQLAPPQSTASVQTQALKQVTILFLDVVGSTTLSEKLDPEEIHEVMDGAMARCTLIVESHAGKVLQYAGDSLLAVFGADEAREDDPERAVRTGLALLAEGLILGEEVCLKHGYAGFNLRVGAHTGRVLLGAGVDAEGSIRGMAVNVAARMEQTAPPGCLRISQDTYRQVRGMFEFERQPALAAKGISDPIDTYLVRRTKERAFRIASRGVEGVETRMVGRDVELLILQDAFRRLFSERRLKVITVVGEAGLGKSRLLYEFEKWAESTAQNFTVFQGRARPPTRSQPYGLLRDILALRYQLFDVDSMQAAKDKLEARVAPLFVPDDGPELAQAHAHLLGHLVGLDFSDSRHVKGILGDPKQVRDRGLHAATQLFRRVTIQDGLPVALNLEDLHWADESSLDFLDNLVRVNGDLPMLVLGLTRPTLFERRTLWTDLDEVHHRIDLEPLGSSHSRELADELLKRLPAVPVALRELVTADAGGNPFYMEEIVKMLVDQRAIEAGADSWSVHPERLLATRVPLTLTGVLQARLDGLPDAERRALQQACIIGLTFWDEALRALDPAAFAALPALLRRELVVAGQEAGLGGAREYSFKHQILHRVTYDTVLKRDRRELHAKTADWLAGADGTRAGDFLGVTAEHYERAGNIDAACEFFARAAEHTSARFAHESVLRYVDKALSLMAETPNKSRGLLQWRLNDVRERTFYLQGKHTEQVAGLDVLDQFAEMLDDNQRRAELAWRRTQLASRTGDERETERAARRAIALAEGVADHSLKLNGMRLLSNALARQGDMDAGVAMARGGLSEARVRGLRRAEANFFNCLALCYAGRDLVVNLAMNEQAMAIYREIGDRHNEAVSLGNLGGGSLDVGQFTRARHYLEDALRVARSIGARMSETGMIGGLSTLAWSLGNYSEALVRAENLRDLVQSTKSKHWEGIAHWLIGQAKLGLSSFVDAETSFERSLTIARSIDSALQIDAISGLARVALAEGNLSRAMEHVGALLGLVPPVGPVEGESPLLTLLTCHQVLSQSGDARAGDVLDRARSSLLAMAELISDEEMKKSFLENISHHREIMAESQNRAD